MLRRLVDLCLALVLLVVLSPWILVIATCILVFDGRPVFYKSERMRRMNEGFTLWKFRTMRAEANDAGVSGGHKQCRISTIGAFLRHYRLDELPQLANIIRGDIGFVGPRPPLRRYVNMFPELYENVLRDRPGVTGFATLVFHAREEVLLSRCMSAEETEDVYCRQCVPRKARLDMIYSKRRTILSDFRMMLATIDSRIDLHGRNGE